jgi:hypothetical protein
MFDQMAKELVSYFPGKAKDFYITHEEFDDFCKNFLFEELKGNYKLGETFCEKYKQTNYVLSILNNRAATAHIRKFYVK